MSIRCTPRGLALAGVTSLLCAGALYGASPAAAVDGCSAVDGGYACWDASRDTFTVRDTSARDGATVRVDYEVDLGVPDVVGRCATTGTKPFARCRLSGLPEGKAVIWHVSTWKDGRLVEQGPTQFHTTHTG
ncbi:hypothetical protein I3F58_19890 [Streptomyces sp. MUM 203J]|uniref:hypothetical protein n=1 Tax=Streptomyces sp. MUM 203J TaxID=2791990 RepID=UPI001F04B06A|nr:hypothetical protein [Streptomyces sp. MUM 203J]MCH0541786.1 hypothetical protein [Streptomyces sp. MUM 203J]